MSWGDGKYFDYCCKVANCIKSNKKRERVILNNSWKYVKNKANLDSKEDFENFIRQLGIT